MKPFRLIVAAALSALLSLPASAQDVTWPEDTMDWIAWSASDVLAAETAEDRAFAMESFRYDLQQAAIQGAPGAELTLLVFQLQIDGEAALAAMRAGIGRGLMANPDSAADSGVVLAVRFMEALNALRRHGPERVGSGAAIAQGLAAVDQALAARDAASLFQQLAALVPNPDARERLENLAGWAQEMADLAEDAEAVADGDAQATEDFINDVAGMIPPSLSPAMASPLGTAFAHQQRWQQEMTQAATDGLNTVADAIETGHFDEERFREISDRLEELSRGPWGEETARDAVRQWCGHLPIGSEVCEKAVDTWEEWSEEALCEAAVNCDCENSEYMFPSVSIPQCYGYEEAARQQCREDGYVSGIGCDPITSGPAAFPL